MPLRNAFDSTSTNEGLKTTTEIGTEERRSRSSVGLEAHVKRPRLAVLQNILAPYRVPILQGLHERFDTTLFLSGVEDDRAMWAGIESTLGAIPVRRTRGFTIRTWRGKPGYDQRYLHLPIGQFLDLVSLRPDAIVTIEMGLRTLLALAYGSITRTPVWVWWGGTLHTERQIGRMRRIVRSIVARWARHWISYGLTSTEYLLRLGVPRERILQIQNCVDERRYLERVDPADRIEPRPVFLHVGRMIGLKGIDRLLEAAATLRAEGRTFSLMLVGDGPEREKLRQRAGELGLPNVHFIPAQSPEKMPAVYRSADFLVFPTRGDVWGLVVNEALWSGVPVLSSIHAGCAAELVPEPQRFDPEDPDELASRMRDAVEGRIPPPDPSVMKTCGEVVEMIAADIERVVGERATNDS